MAEDSTEVTHRNLAKHTHEMQERRANRDSMTGLFNKGFFVTQLEKLKGDDEATVVMIDIDDFKAINDKHGHMAGDKVITSVSRTIQSKVRIVGNDDEADTLARLGGDEFSILFRKLSDPVIVRERIGEIIKAVEESFVVEKGQQIKSTLSIGIAVRKPNELPEDLIDRADKAMYLAKGNGGNSYTESQ